MVIFLVSTAVVLLGFVLSLDRAGYSTADDLGPSKENNIVA